jgi:hypothetical protein
MVSKAELQLNGDEPLLCSFDVHSMAKIERPDSIVDYFSRELGRLTVRQK